MTDKRFAAGVVSNRLSTDHVRQNFAELHPPLSGHEALVAADRCYFCHDAPCIAACPTTIDIPLFIRQIMTGDTMGAAETILDQNILGGLCGRVCPTESLCEGACVREFAEGAPVQIGLLQRHATDHAMAENRYFYRRAPDTHKRVAVIGAGPAGLACAHRLSMYGNRVVIFDEREKPGGLNEYGIAPYRTVDNFAQDEIDYISNGMEIEIRNGTRIGRDMTWQTLREEFDAIFLGIGLTGCNSLPLGDEESYPVANALEFIAQIRQASDLAGLPVGRRVVVIGGGMTACDIATQCMLLGAEQVTICYRRGPEEITATLPELDHARATGVTIRYWLQPTRTLVETGQLVGMEFEYTQTANGTLVGTDEHIVIPTDQVFQAIGQTAVLDGIGTDHESLAMVDGRIAVDEEGRTSVPGVWAGGDCIARGADLTVTAVAHGRDAAASIHRQLTGGGVEVAHG